MANMILIVLLICWSIIGLIHYIALCIDYDFDDISDRRKKSLLILLEGPLAWVCAIFVLFMELIIMLWVDVFRGIYQKFMKYIKDDKEETTE